ncbi:MAG: hypothetical protein P9L97_00225 [Candidatus Tenebribacter davisii]|nr:hypothetical protein [Candidatus Tenebribacter davisii]
MEFLEALLIGLLSTGAGYLGGLLTHKLNVKRENINVTRERLLKEIFKVEDYLELLVEIGHLGTRILMIHKVNDSYQTSHVQLGNEQSQIGDDINFIENEIEKANTPDNLQLYKSRLNELHSRLSEIDDELSGILYQLEHERHELDQGTETLDDHIKRNVADDINTTAHIIDPSGDLIQYLEELTSIYSDPENLDDSSARVAKLRGKVDTILNQKILKVG